MFAIVKYDARRELLARRFAGQTDLPADLAQVNELSVATTDACSCRNTQCRLTAGKFEKIHRRLCV